MGEGRAAVTKGYSGKSKGIDDPEVNSHYPNGRAGEIYTRQPRQTDQAQVLSERLARPMQSPAGLICLPMV